MPSKEQLIGAVVVGAALYYLYSSSASSAAVGDKSKEVPPPAATADTAIPPMPTPVSGGTPSPMGAAKAGVLGTMSAAEKFYKNIRPPP
jgi:hypothetical protein